MDGRRTGRGFYGIDFLRQTAHLIRQLVHLVEDIFISSGLYVGHLILKVIHLSTRTH
jgi:hypothetical protein